MTMCKVDMRLELTCISPGVKSFLDPQQRLLCINAIQVSQQACSQGSSAPPAAPAVHVYLLACF